MKDLRDLYLLMSLTRARKSTLKARSVLSQDSQKVITTKTEIHHAVIYAFRGTEISEFPTSNLYRILGIAASCFSLKDRGKKVVARVMDFDGLQKMSSGNKPCLGGYPATLAALHASHFNCFFFTPQYVNDYYVTREPIHSFTDDNQGEVMAGVPQAISQRNVSTLSISGLIDQNEEGIAEFSIRIA